MFKKILIFLFFILFVVAATLAGIFGYLYLQKDKLAQELTSERDQLEIQVEELETSESECDEACVHSLEDIGLDFKFEYPNDWKGVANTTWTDDTIYDESSDAFGPIVETYQILFTSGDTELKFDVLLGPVDGFPSGLTSEEHDFVEISDSVVRWKLKSEETWSYSSKSGCELPGDEDISGVDICIGPFFPGMLDTGAVQATLSPENEADIEAADQIVLSLE